MPHERATGNERTRRDGGAEGSADLEPAALLTRKRLASKVLPGME